MELVDKLGGGLAGGGADGRCGQVEDAGVSEWGSSLGVFRSTWRRVGRREWAVPSQARASQGCK